MLTKEKCLEKYEECKLSKNGPTPACQEFLKFADIDKRTLARLFGSAAYSKLQELAGDMPNRLQLERTPLETIMRQYGNLVTELGVVPAYAEWDHRRLRPTETGLSKKPHKIKWSEMPTKFVEWVTINNISGFEVAINVIAASTQSTNNKLRNRDSDFGRLIKDIREWTPARRRNSKAEYKIELRKHVGHEHQAADEIHP